MDRQTLFLRSGLSSLVLLLTDHGLLVCASRAVACFVALTSNTHASPLANGAARWSGRRSASAVCATAG